MTAFIDLSGQHFGRLTIVRYIGDQKWECLCDCGNAKNARSGNLKNGYTRSCGCLRKEVTRKRVTKHGHTGNRSVTREYQAWQAMLRRCYYRQHPHWLSYGGRGIIVAPEWINDFSAFLAHVGPKPTARHTLDRVDNDSNYEPGNVRWATRSRQSRNQRRNKLYSYKGRSLCLADLIELSGLKGTTIQGRLALGWSAERAVHEPVGTTTRWSSHLASP